MPADSCHSSPNSSEPAGGMIDEVIPMYIHMFVVISDVRKPHWSSECYINKCGVISYHQEEKPSKLSRDAAD